LHGRTSRSWAEADGGGLPKNHGGPGRTRSRLAACQAGERAAAPVEPTLHAVHEPVELLLHTHCSESPRKGSVMIRKALALLAFAVLAGAVALAWESRQDIERYLKISRM
jgi:hypothetical protein